MTSAYNISEKQFNSQGQESKVFSTESGRDIYEADPHECILRPDRSPDFGEITPDIADKLRIMPGKIRLNVGADVSGNRFGVTHIEQRHIGEIKKAGYLDVPSFVEDVLANWNEIRDGGNGGLFMVKRGNPHGLAIIEIAPEKRGTEAYYRVESAWPTTKDRWINNKLLLVERPPLQP